MFKLSFITLLALFVAISVLSQTSPHGENLSIKCDACHISTSWTTIVIKKDSFNHNKTVFPLVGQHQTVTCKKCHVDLIFSHIKSDCNSCHVDIHQQTVGHDCERCHTPATWLINNISRLHNLSRFPLQGRHAQADCNQCHKSASLLRFDPMGTQCIDCHANDYLATTNPSHVASKFPKDCFLCHNENNWQSSTFNHNSSGFPLTGAHLGVACVSCHKSGYTVIPTTCVSCHLNNYNTTTNPNHTLAKFSTDCQSCHNVNTWSPAIFNHNTATSFPLTGAHIGVTCISCHTKGFAGIPTTCASCHLSNYNATTNPNHIATKFPTTCESCHTATAWVPSTFNHNTATTFPLTGGHLGVACVSCHKSGYTAIPTTCVSCHLNSYNATTNPNHTLAKFSTDCQSCHNVTTWSPSTFNHNTATSFPLTGGHIGVACISCHPTNYNTIPTTCVSCHLNNYNATTNPSHIAARFPTTCETCHTTTVWQPSTFNHSTATSFPLTGAHIGVACISCHANGYTGGTPTTCVGCHLSNFNASTNPNHTLAKFSTDCQTCHSITAWTPTTFNHNTATSFPLAGAHIGVTCISCHTKGYAGIPTTCVSCHLTTYNATTNPNHTTSKFPTTCETCHRVTAWVPSTFNHNTSTSFPLTGGHIGVACVSCHPTNYNAIPTTCVSCHLTNYNATTNPSHTTARFPTTCETCHTTTVWQPSTFNHSTATSFPLTGAHIGVACISCHSNGYTGGTPTTCVGCHLSNFNASTNPNHTLAKFSTDCQTCHSITAWTPTTFNHTTATSFPLSGAHIGVTCISCHTKGYAGIPTMCVSCHLTTYNATTNPNHIISKFPTTCETCHTVTSWVPSTFNHNTSTSFSLTGGHIGVACVSCHPTNYSPIPTTCVSCHLTNYNATTNPSHTTARFPTTCETCHTTTVWQPSTFNHSTATSFPLTGAHIGVACINCHANGYTGGTPTTCVGCHLSNFNASTNPNHTLAKFSTDCLTCHNVTAWTPTTFNHTTATSFPLAGAHKGVTCISCHTKGYAGIPTTCVSCHLTNYNAATNPDHKVNPSVFTTDCISCHNVTAWSPAPQFNHTTFFPISSGRHSGISCATCHTNSTNYVVFSCVTAACHKTAHNQNQGSAGCYSCHPTGRAD